jgi:hypothetical protein
VDLLRSLETRVTPLVLTASLRQPGKDASVSASKEGQHIPQTQIERDFLWARRHPQVEQDGPATSSFFLK